MGEERSEGALESVAQLAYGPPSERGSTQLLSEAIIAKPSMTSAEINAMMMALFGTRTPTNEQRAAFIDGVAEVLDEA